MLSLWGKGTHKKVFSGVEKGKQEEEIQQWKNKGNNNRDVVIVGDFFVVCDSYLENVNLSCDEMDWVVDIGASTHATSRHDIFST